MQDVRMYLLSVGHYKQVFDMFRGSEVCVAGAVMLHHPDAKVRERLQDVPPDYSQLGTGHHRHPGRRYVWISNISYFGHCIYFGSEYNGQI